MVASRDEQEHLDYSPEVVEFWHTAGHWRMLQSACEGGTGATGLGSGKGKRQNLSDLKADLELAADSLPLNWSATARIFKIQQRWRQYVERCEQAGERGGELEQPIDVCFYRMAEWLGWS